MFSSNRNYWIFTLLYICLAGQLHGQPISLFEAIPTHKEFLIEGATTGTLAQLQLSPKALNILYKSKQDISFRLPLEGQNITLQIYATEIATIESQIQTLNNGQLTSHFIQMPHTYRGTILEYPGAFVALTTDSQTLRCFMAIPGQGQFNIGLNASKNDLTQYIITGDKNLVGLPDFTCSAIDDLFYRNADQFSYRSVRPTCKKVQISIHADYDLYLSKNSNLQLVANYIFGLFNESGTLFLNEGIHISISEIIIHTAEDGLPHTSASDDLAAFKRKFRSYRGDAIFCLSGYRDGNNQAPLGGTAYTNSLCVKRYSYAYANIQGSYELYPNYSWDVQAFTHEMGHIMGSPHTHSCTWGPNQNEALDNCYTPTGGCAPGPPPVKGTIMSYCHLPGRPGIDFTYGFGQEPGDRIRAKIASSPCLIDYIPERNIVSEVNEIVANVQCSDGDITHYYYNNHTIDEADDIWILSIDTKGFDIGNIGDPNFEVKVEMTSANPLAQEITAEYVDPTKPFFVIHSYWSVTPVRQPNQPVIITFPFTNEAYESLKRQIPDLTMSEVKAYSIVQPGTANPARNHAGTTSNEYQSFIYATTPAAESWTYTYSPNGYHIASYEVAELAEGGMGANANTILPIVISSFEGTAIRDKNYINWSTSSEINSDRFVIERSINGQVFIPMDEIYTQGWGNGTASYEYIDEMPFPEATYYRLKMIDLDGSFVYSETIVVFNDNVAIQTPNYRIYPNPVSNGQINIAISSNRVDEAVTIRIINLLGIEVLTTKFNTIDQTQTLDISTLQSGLYMLEINTSQSKSQHRIIVQ